MTFQPIAIAPVGHEATGVDVDLLAIDENDPDIIYASVARFPSSEFIRSMDGGQSWESLSTIDDFPESLVLTTKLRLHADCNAALSAL